MSTSEDDILFLDDIEGSGQADSGLEQHWKMLIVDDEPEVHSITRLVLADFMYKGRPARFLSAYSASDARAILDREDDIAIILLDVVMETDDAGLTLVRYIREELKNRHVRIILRTGQPGQAPERAVILDYDINDYKAKTQLTAQQLFTTTVAALRSYEDIMAIETNRRGLEKIIEASSSLFQSRSMKLFAAGVLTQLAALLGVGPDAILCVQRGPVLGGPANGLYVLAGSGRFEPLINELAGNHVDADVLASVVRCLSHKRNFYERDYCTLYIRTPNRRENVVYLRSNRPLSALDQTLIEVFCSRISVGFDNLHLYDQLRWAQAGALALLADMADHRLDRPAGPAPRLAATAEAIARRLQDTGALADVVDEPFVEFVGFASILHDVGNAAIDPAILGKPGPLSDAERLAMQEHAACGAALLERVNIEANACTLLHLGAEVARHHHENWDGSGYPDGLAGEAIPLAARIVAAADGFDAMTSERPYRPAMSRDEALAEIRRLSGVRYDPAVVDALLAVTSETG
jgi:response regulator RpfG family c-di-GMP phosphodiesterase